ncbi:thermonuclease family protein [Streptomyces sp. NPDC002896]|uniref:thermonuclease family protein n=1 Tax=Streptomyces sp. NPDC002896 TaxID=3154438 RepID=UPI003330B72C
MVVLRVIDGDTIEVRGDGRIVPKGTVARVRLLEIDTPERGACFADAATARTIELLPPGSSARIQRDAELTDRYDRYLLYVWNERGTFVNQSLVSSGHAEAVLFPLVLYVGALSDIFELPDRQALPKTVDKRCALPPAKSSRPTTSTGR